MAEQHQRHLADWPAENRFAERHLRRFLALGYVLSEPLRTRWDSTELGPSHRAARAAARALVRARAGDLGPAATLPDNHALCFLPLPWSVELAARLAGANHPRGVKLGQWLADTVGAAAHRQFRDLAREATDAACGAARLHSVSTERCPSANQRGGSKPPKPTDHIECARGTRR